MKFYNKIYRYIKNKMEYSYYEKIMKYVDLDRIRNVKPEKVNKISFIIPAMEAYNGGLTSILRLGTYLSQLGYKISYICYNNQSIEDMKKNAEINLSNYKGDFYDKSYLFNFNSDVVISTFWESVYYTKKMNGYKIYFVQDYEPYFYIYGERYILAKKTYELGYHIVSLGKWNKYIIEKNCNIADKIDFIEFPYEKSEYKKTERKFSEYKNKKIFEIAVYTKFEPKRAPYIIQEIMQNIILEFDKIDIKINVNYFGSDKSIRFKNGVNLGKLNKIELADLYDRCDFGMCFSLTNISLVPYEMIASKLPLIEFKEGTFKYFFNEKNAILISFNWKDLYEKLAYYIKNTKELEHMTENAYSELEKLSWKNSANQFATILESLI